MALLQMQYSPQELPRKPIEGKQSLSYARHYQKGLYCHQTPFSSNPEAAFCLPTDAKKLDSTVRSCQGLTFLCGTAAWGSHMAVSAGMVHRIGMA